jgi:hypothetical protein
LATKQFSCLCERCTVMPDEASAIPCPCCHPRTRQLDEDVQYDDEHTVHYVRLEHPGQANTMVCPSCHTHVSPDDQEYAMLFKVMQSATAKVVTFFLDHQAMEKVKYDQEDNEDIDEADHIKQELLEQQIRIASNVLGARHWTTNLLLLLQLDQQLQRLHGDCLTEGMDPDMDTIAESIDMLERLRRFVDDLGLHLDKGHVLSDVIVGVARALVSLGDTKSQKYAADWLDTIDDFVQVFESEGMKKVVGSLQVAWKRSSAESSSNKKPKLM